MRRSILIAVLLIGFTAMVSQIILIRELIIVFYGNELSLGLILASWLFWAAVGSWGLGRFVDRLRAKLRLLIILQILLSFLLPLAVLSIRVARNFIAVVPGEIIGLIPMAAMSFFVLAPVCVSLGFLFALACRIYPGASAHATQSEPAGRIGRVYILEAIGAACGGLLTSFFLIRYLSSLHIIFILSLLNLLTALLLTPLVKFRGRFVLRAVTLVLILGTIFLFISGGVDQLHQLFLNLQWKGYSLLTSQNSIYGNVAITRSDSQISFFNNGLHTFTFSDPLSAEEVIHFPLLEHPDPKDILLIGGGAGGALAEALKHPIRKVDYVELDPLIIELAKKYLPSSQQEVLREERVKVHHIDGRLFVKRRLMQIKANNQQAKSAKISVNGLYDVVIVNLPDPFTAQINRFYTLEFFREVKEILSPTGIVSIGVTASENYVGGELQRLLSCLYRTLKEVFPDVLVIPGDYAYFLACKSGGILTYDYNILMQRLADRGIDTQFVREYYLFSKLSSERIDYYLNRIQEAKGAKINRDFRPICYYYGLVLWTTYFKISLVKIFKAVSEVKIWIGASLVYLSILLLATFRKRLHKMRPRAVLLAVGTTGFAEIVFQIVVILSFQIIYGYMFYKLGLILTSFMMGLILGGWWITKIMSRLRDDFATFIRTQVVICLYPLILPVIFYWLATSTGKTTSWLGANLIVPFLPLVAGFIGGFQFPLANKIYLGKRAEIGRVAGLTYGIDLLGACAGAILASAFILPILGIYRTCLMVALLNVSCLVLLISHKKLVGVKN